MPFSQPWPAGGQASFSKGLANRTLNAEAKRNALQISILPAPYVVSTTGSHQIPATIWPYLTVSRTQAVLVQCAGLFQTTSSTAIVTLQISGDYTNGAAYYNIPTTANPYFSITYGLNGPFEANNINPVGYVDSGPGFDTFFPYLNTPVTGTLLMGWFAVWTPPQSVPTNLMTLNDPVLGALNGPDQLGYIPFTQPPDIEFPFTLDDAVLGELDSSGELEF